MDAAKKAAEARQGRYKIDGKVTSKGAMPYANTGRMDRDWISFESQSTYYGLLVSVEPDNVARRSLGVIWAMVNGLGLLILGFGGSIPDDWSAYILTIYISGILIAISGRGRRCVWTLPEFSIVDFTGEEIIIPATMIPRVLDLNLPLKVAKIESSYLLASSLYRAMWSPQDINAIPSIDDIIPAKNAIDALEARLLEAQRLVDELQQEITARKAWIAPIRRLPSELLSIIFVHRCRRRWDAPLTIQLVSRWWRKIIIQTPQAWTFIPLREFNDSKQVENLAELFLRRGRQWHVSLPLFSKIGKMRRLLGPLANVSNHIVCMYDINPIANYQLRYRNLEDLDISWDDRWLPKTLHVYLDTDHFPRLRTLSFTLRGEIDLRTRMTFSSSSIPPLQYLELHTQDFPSVSSIIQACSSTLKFLICGFNSQSSLGMTTPRKSVHFPELHSVRLLDTHHDSKWLLEAITPKLRAYEAIGTFEGVSVDTSNVEYLDTLDHRILYSYSSLRFLDLSRYPLQSVVTTLEYLVKETEVCPKLKTIITLRGQHCEYSPTIRNISSLITRGGELVELTQTFRYEWWMKPTLQRSCHSSGRVSEQDTCYNVEEDEDLE
ncbi:hypothetical protein M408DRAFT_29176 [Serendipita vermifera MAFF 305830]|uniref:F-box domain-containing protein n=1 Tax=Serendipita vermifera MAFF 305830 TaxID=933852 RepID=A0A0C2WX41_SERVB|nr:hypothetical protein M408DRAFT_29176 [Serendipita vermifera MAFF 305830]